MRATKTLFESAVKVDLVVPRIKRVINSGQPAFYSLSHVAISLFAARNEDSSALMQYVPMCYCDPTYRFAATTSCASLYKSCRESYRVQAFHGSRF